MNFSDLGLGDSVLRAVDDAGYKDPTPIQEKAIPYVLMGRDILGCAQTGTGKTASFTLPMIEILAEGRAKARMPRSLILCPTRELAAQVAVNFDTYGKYNKLTKALLIGGVSFVEQDRLIDRGTDVLIATPGRLLDHFERGKVLLNDIKILVIDEADRMLDMGFIPDVERIVDVIPKIRQTLFFSATLPPEIRRLADKFLINPKEVYVAPPASPAENVQQHLVMVRERDKPKVLRELIASENVKSALIFCNRKKDVATLCDTLKRGGFNVAELHGDMHQEARTRTLARFKNDEITLLVCSDVAARGLDISELSHVFNYDVPMHAEDYIHRIGRTARAGRKGRAFTLASSDDAKFLGAIERMLGKKIPQLDAEAPAATPAVSDEATVSESTEVVAESADAAAESSPRKSRRRGRGKAREKDKDKESAAAFDATADEGADKGEDAAASENADDERPAKSDASSSRRGGRKRDDSKREDRREPVLAFGDDVPAFFRQAIPAGRSR